MSSSDQRAEFSARPCHKRRCGIPYRRSGARWPPVRPDTSEQRCSPENGIWLCANCARLIDSDFARFTVALLHAWKAQAEGFAQLSLAAPPRGTDVVSLEAVLSGHANYVWDVVVTPDGRRAVSVSNDKTVGVWEFASDRRIATLRGHVTEVCSVAIDRRGERVAAGALDGTVRCWNLGRFTLWCAGLRYVPNESCLAARRSDCGGQQPWTLDRLDVGTCRCNTGPIIRRF
ncbi:WD40 repeat domain-containing protein [Nocardia vulneris]|uniref:WD40 repeat domain-containing protein n=1 Tax=Nocardia vulneris TaxID=1141657 RepID=UPI003BAE8E74